MIHILLDRLLILRSDLQNNINGDFASGKQIGVAEGTGTYRIGKTGSELEKLDCSHISVETLSGETAGPFRVTNLAGFDNTCKDKDCKNNFNDIGGGYFWAGGGERYHGSKHFGLMKKADMHVWCNSTNDKELKWGHFHRYDKNEGIYSFGDRCFKETPALETFSFYVLGCTGMTLTGSKIISSKSYIKLILHL